ncbi:MAG: hypothetical protein DWQ05_06210 [Calditrichaeota bacterium]|nr:MAG: hypothetical protein DWQ05_06210 [Calditrichota bacterium]
MTSTLDDYLQDLWAEKWPGEGGQLNVQDMSAGFAYSIFGLPDGTFPPQSTTIAPGPDTLQNALLDVIRPMLQRNETFILKTPFEFARVPFIDAAHVFEKSGGQWIVLNYGLFGALYSVNDRFLEILEVNSGIKKVDDPIELVGRFPDLLCQFMLGECPNEKRWHVRMTTRVNPDLCHLIGTYTSVQQIFFLLHELGHAFYSHGIKMAHPFSSKFSVWQSGESPAKAEKLADAFAAEHLRSGPLPARLSDNPEAVVIGLFLLFESLELLRKLGKYSPGSHRLPRKRFKKMAKSIDRKSYKNLKKVLTSQQSLFDDVYTVWRINQN